MRRTSDAERIAVSQLDGPKRFAHSMKRIADEELAWGLWRDDWLLIAGAEEALSLPLWPASEYAQMMCVQDWADAVPRPITSEQLIDELLPGCELRGLSVAVFPTTSGRGVVVPPSVFRVALQDELHRFP